MKKITKSFVVVVLSVVLALVNVSTFSGTTVRAATVLQTDVTAPSSGNIFISVDGMFYTEEVTTLINRINEIRYEACKEGITNPDTSNKLTMSDYKPIQWATSLEEYARVRAVEASVNWSHTRPNNSSTFKTSMAKLKNGYYSGENLARGYTLRNSIEGYYSEKSNWKKNSGIYGHYTSMISPSNTLVGMVAFQQKNGTITSSMEFGSLWKTETNSNTSKKIGLSEYKTQIVEVNASYLVSSISLTDSKSVNVGSTVNVLAIANMKNATKQATITKGLTWKSSNTKVATVDSNGKVKGIAEGTATITASIGNKIASVKVTVKPVKATSIEAPSFKTMYEGETYSIRAQVLPSNTTNSALNYATSNAKVATVDKNGKVIAKSAGTATITLTTKDGSNKKATIKITVKKAIKVSSITLNAKSVSIKKGKTFQLKATVKPTNATNKNLSYTSSNTKIAVVDKNGKITAKGVGTTKITVASKDGNKKITINVKVTK